MSSASDKSTISLSSKDFEFGFMAMRQGLGQFIDNQFKQELNKVLVEEYKLEIKNWKPMLKLWQDYNKSLHDLYLMKTLEICHMGAGGGLAAVTSKVMEDKPKEKEKKKKKTVKKVDPSWHLVKEAPKEVPTKEKESVSMQL